MTLQEVRQQYPQYSDMSDAELAKALHAKFYSDMPVAEFAAKVGLEAKPEAKQSRSIPDQIARQVGLTARAGIGGAAGLGSLIADPVVHGLNFLGAGLPIPSQSLEKVMTAAGLPEPENAVERVAQGAARAMAGTGAVARIAQAPGFALPQFGERVGMQTGAAGAAGIGSQLAAEMGGGPMTQFVSGLGAGVVAPAAGYAALKAGQAGLRAVPALTAPLTDAGRETIAARALQRTATNPAKAAAAASSAPEYVPGSKPTLAQASEDAGLALGEKAVRNRSAADFANRAAEQDAARRAGLERSFGRPSDLTVATAERDTVTAAMREAAFENAGKVNTKPIVDAVKLLKGASAREDAQKAMGWVLGRLQEAGKDPRRIYDVRKDINDVIAGNVRDPARADLALAAKQLTQVRQVIDAQLEVAAPGFKNYLKTYAGMSREIDKAALGQEITAASRNPMTEQISPAQFTRQFEKRGAEIAEAGPVASDALTRVAMDLRRAAAPQAAGRTPGSDTLQNIVANNALSRVGVPNANGPISNAAAKILGLAYRPLGAEDAVQEIVKRAYLDPQYGAGLLGRSLPKDPDELANVVRGLLAIQRGGLLGAVQ